MIHLPPTIAKVAKRIVLIKLAKVLVLGATQFGSRRRRGTHDAISVVYKFIKHNDRRAVAMRSLDLEGGFDNIKTDLLFHYLSARGCTSELTLWIKRGASSRTVRFGFNNQCSKVYHINKGIPQGSPLSPFVVWCPRDGYFQTSFPIYI